MAKRAKTKRIEKPGSEPAKKLQTKPKMSRNQMIVTGIGVLVVLSMSVGLLVSALAN